MSDKGRVASVATTKCVLDVLFTGADFGDAAFLPIFLFELIMPCFLRGGELVVLSLGIFDSLDMGASINLFLGRLGAPFFS